MIITTRAFIKLLFAGASGLIVLVLSTKFLDGHGYFSSSMPLDDLSLSSLKINSNGRYLETLDKPDVLRRVFPNCLIIGFSKCGTHALRVFLTLHPNVVADDPELGFFNKYYDKGLEWYRQQMPLSRPGQVVIEKTPSYILDKMAVRRMRDLDSNMKLIVLVRDPVVRVQSMYARLVWKLGTHFNIPFANWVKGASISALTKTGNYAPYIRDVYNIFNKSQVLVLDGELLARNPIEVVLACERFLKLEPVFRTDFFVYHEEKRFYCVNTSIPNFRRLMESNVTTKLSTRTGCFSGAKGREHPKISEGLKKYLTDLYRATTEDLFHVIGKRFEWTGIGQVDDRSFE